MISTGISIPNPKANLARNKIRIAYIAWTEPGSTSGATLAIQRHLFECSEFDVLVCNDKPFRGFGLEENWRHFCRPWLHHRLSRTRLRRWISQYEMLLEPYLAARRLLPAVERFEPDLILTIPDNTLSWAAFLISRKLGLPLVTNFQDWWPRAQFFAPGEVPYPPTRAVLEFRFRRFYKASRVAFCTSEGFKKYLGPHPDAPVLYPCPAPRLKERPAVSLPSNDKPLRVVYGGTLVRFYGEMILSLAKALRDDPNFELRLFGGKPDWNEEDLAWAKETGIYGGQLSQADYRVQLAAGDVFITAMSSAPELEIMMKTSFTTKFLEYCQFAKPVIVWGPPYCEPLRVARETGAGIPVVGSNPLDVIEALEALKKPEAYRLASDAAWKAATGIFDPDKIHAIFCDGIAGSVGNR
jgi:glycosyltransferase involved in cell wall biosynthesis